MTDSKNPALERLHSDLIDQADEISDAIVEESNLALVRVMVSQVDAINGRVAVVGSLLFTRQIKEISDLMPSVDAAAQRLGEAVQSGRNATNILANATAFLAVVDEVIGVARTF